ncbi:hypothetical protein BT67DRAFT_52951 [Trichocladium antarcticum]|uniref:Uncharacterized protein n=1 Tax=Trichocladium antarcticum TaxID=1450529 RepID=A0AAN6ZD79_9PEZI|nr:hypothetical protein BT67DRAFT_52951 [Trichocladium antarcticum]
MRWSCCDACGALPAPETTTVVCRPRPCQQACAVLRAMTVLPADGRISASAEHASTSMRIICFPFARACSTRTKFGFVCGDSQPTKLVIQAGPRAYQLPGTLSVHQIGVEAALSSIDTLPCPPAPLMSCHLPTVSPDRGLTGPSSAAVVVLPVSFTIDHRHVCQSYIQRCVLGRQMAGRAPGETRREAGFEPRSRPGWVVLDVAGRHWVRDDCRAECLRVWAEATQRFFLPPPVDGARVRVPGQATLQLPPARAATGCWFRTVGARDNPTLSEHRQPCR